MPATEKEMRALMAEFDRTAPDHRPWEAIVATLRLEHPSTPAEERAKERATCSECLARTYRGNEDCVCEDSGDAEDYDAALAEERSWGRA